MTQTRTTKASADDRRLVRHITFRSIARPGISGTVTGIVASETDDEMIVHMYSAGCLNGVYTIDKNRNEITEQTSL